MRIPHLFTKRVDVMNFNKKVFHESDPLRKTIIEAVDSVSGEMSPHIRHQILSKIPLDTAKQKDLQFFYT